MTPLAIFLLGCATVFLGAIQAAFSTLMRLSLRLMAERGGRSDRLGHYLDDPLQLFLPLRMLIGISTVVAGVLIAQLSDVHDAASIATFFVSLVAFVVICEHVLPMLIVRRDPEAVLDVLLPAFHVMARPLRPLTSAMIGMIGPRREREAGNGGGTVSFPANYPGIIGVSSVNQSGQLVSTANRGPQVAVLAPGTHMVSTRLGGGAGTIQDGTSFASPLVAGTVAQLLAVDPSLSRDQIRSNLMGSGTSVTDASGTYVALNSGKSVVSLLPDLIASGQSFASSGALTVAYSLPALGSAVDLYVAVDTPFGPFCLLPSGIWSDASQAGYQPVATSYLGLATAQGTLFGQGGPFPTLSLAGLPSGRYVWLIAAVSRSSGKVVGTIVESPISIVAQ